MNLEDLIKQAKEYDELDMPFSSVAMKCTSPLDSGNVFLIISTNG
jgi:hypothetical protein